MVIPNVSRTAADYAKELTILEKEVARDLEAGEIDKPAYEGLKYRVERAIEGTSKLIAEEHLYGKGGAIYRLDGDNKHWGALVSAIPLHYARDVLSLEKKLGKIKPDWLKNHPFYKDCAAYFGRYKGVAANLVALKEKIVSTAKRREQKAERAEQERKEKFTEYKTLVVVLQEHLNAYVARAGTVACEDFDGWMEELKSCEWDIDRVAPEPTRDDSHELYVMKNRRRRLFLSITEPVSRANQLTRKMSIERKATHVANAKDGAHAAYMEWIYKMIQKIGQPVAAAAMVGDPWINSTVTITTRDGGYQVWQTQMILNRSKYDRPFNQFPSRRMDQ